MNRRSLLKLFPLIFAPAALSKLSPAKSVAAKTSAFDAGPFPPPQRITSSLLIASDEWLGVHISLHPIDDGVFEGSAREPIHLTHYRVVNDGVPSDPVRLKHSVSMIPGDSIRVTVKKEA